MDATSLQTKINSRTEERNISISQEINISANVADMTQVKNLTGDEEHIIHEAQDLHHHDHPPNHQDQADDHHMCEDFAGVFEKNQCLLKLQAQLELSQTLSQSQKLQSS